MRSAPPPESPSSVSLSLAPPLDAPALLDLLRKPTTEAAALTQISTHPPLALRPPFAQIDADDSLDEPRQQLLRRLSEILLTSQRGEWERRADVLRAIGALGGAAACWRRYVAMRHADLAAAGPGLIGLSPLAERVAVLHAQAGMVTSFLEQDLPLIHSVCAPLLSAERDVPALLSELYLDQLAQYATQTATLIESAADEASVSSASGNEQNGAVSMSRQSTVGSTKRRAKKGANGTEGGAARRWSSAIRVSDASSVASAVLAAAPREPSSGRRLVDWPATWRIASGVTHAVERALDRVERALAQPTAWAEGSGAGFGAHVRTAFTTPPACAYEAADAAGKADLGASAGCNSGLGSARAHYAPGLAAPDEPAYATVLDPARILSPYVSHLCTDVDAHIRRLVSSAIAGEGPPSAPPIPYVVARSSSSFSTAAARLTAVRTSKNSSSSRTAPWPQLAPAPVDGAASGHRLAATAMGRVPVLRSVATILSSLRLHLPCGVLIGKLTKLDDTLAVTLAAASTAIGEHLMAVCARVISPPQAVPNKVRVLDGHEGGKNHPASSSACKTCSPPAIARPAVASADCTEPDAAMTSGTLPTSLFAICLNSARAVDFFLETLLVPQSAATSEEVLAAAQSPAEAHISWPHSPRRSFSRREWSSLATARLASAREYLRAVGITIREMLCSTHARLMCACALTEPKWLASRSQRPGAHRSTEGVSYGMVILSSGLGTLQAELVTYRIAPMRVIHLRGLRHACLRVLEAYWGCRPTQAMAQRHRADLMFMAQLILSHAPEVASTIRGGAHLAGIDHAASRSAATAHASAEMEMVHSELDGLAGALLCALSLVSLVHAPADAIAGVASLCGPRGEANGEQGVDNAAKSHAGLISDWADVGARALSSMSQVDRDKLSAFLDELGVERFEPLADPVREHRAAIEMADRACSLAVDWTALLKALPIRSFGVALLCSALSSNCALRFPSKEDRAACQLALELGVHPEGCLTGLRAPE